jgi:release factor glutamine methyltransferase
MAVIDAIVDVAARLLRDGGRCRRRARRHHISRTVEAFPHSGHSPRHRRRDLTGGPVRHATRRRRDPSDASE